MWNKKESNNYIFNYHPNSTAEIEIDKIVDLQETCYEYICDVLDVKMDKKIEYFLCDTSMEVGELYGDNDPCNGFARMPNKIYAVYNEKVKCVGYHEDAHMISYVLQRPKQAFLREGLAMYFDKTWWGIPNYAWVQVLMDNNLCPKITELIIDEKFYEYNCIVSYPLVGAFVEYIINAFGIHKFKEFYKNVREDFEISFFEILGKSLEDVEDKFTKYINNISVCEILETSIKKHYLDNGVIS